MKIPVVIFSGASLAPNPKLLPDGVGVKSLNQKPGRGDFQPWHRPLGVASVPAAGRKTIYRFGRDVVSDANYWFSWNTVVHAVRGYNQADTTERTYYTGDGIPKWTDNTIALAGAPYPTASRPLGVPAPVNAPTAVSAGDGVAENTESRYYVYTYVNTKGDEGAPSPVSAEVVCKTDDTVNISGLSAPPSGYFIDRIRHYRTQSGTSGDTEFFFLRETSASILATTDDNRALGEVLPTDGFLVPPTDLSYLTPMWNGMLAGISGGAVRLCAAYMPYAWPIAYEILPPDAKPVALGRWEANLLILTTAKPLLVTGTSPDSIDQQPIGVGQSCIAAQSAVSFGHGVLWASKDGLAYYGGGRAPGIITSELMTLDDWKAFNPATITAAQYEGAYFCNYTDNLGVRRAFLIDPIAPTGLYMLEKGYDAVWYDELAQALYVLDGTSIQKWDAGAAFMTAVFRSKVYASTPENLAAGQVAADVFPVTVRIDALAMDPAIVAKRVAARPGVFSAPTATSLRFTKTVTSPDPFRLPDGFRARDWQVEIQTSTPMLALQLAGSVAELTT